MQFLTAPGGGDVAAMKSSETLIVEGALSLYVLKNPNSNLAIDMLRDVVRFNEAREARMDDAAERAAARAE
ncbi:hypothetical protein ACFVXC_35345 [Streptomyces sp. NPDC058257]|uniref:hypothetical protein n=1 Tax=unclassified Streptomyces TaxID=2593676 RepID=UPI003651A866